MMHGREKSDSAIVAGKPANKAVLTAAEPVERRARTKGNANQQSMGRAQNRAAMSQALERIREAAKERKKERFTALLHHINIDLLDEAFCELKENAAAGVDGLTWREYEQNLESNLEGLHARIHRGAYRALPSRRVYIPKPDGRRRPLAVAALEDKIVQRATAAVLNAIYEEDFLGFSYGFRPGRGAHDALDALAVALTSRKVNFVLDADIWSFFDTVNHDWLIRFLEHRIGDRRIMISPLLANVYLHYVFDLWAERWRRREATGDVIIVRYADDFLVGFQHVADARRFWDDMRKRFEEFSLSLNPGKTRLIEFGRFAAERRAQRGFGKPETFNFLGFTFICGRNRRGQFLIKRITRRDRMRATLREIKEGMRRRMHDPIPEQGAWIKQVVRGFFAYYAVPTNGAALRAFYHHVGRFWLRTLRRRSQKNRLSWSRMQNLTADWLPQPRILHPYPDKRFAVTHPRWEPCAGIPPARI